MRDKIYDLEQRLRELIQHGTENDLIGEKLHRATLALFAAPDLETTLAVLSHSLKEDFGVPQVATRLWGRQRRRSASGARRHVGRDARVRRPLARPLLRTRARPESREWFDAATAPASFAYLPLRTDTTFGMLALASDDARRFHAGMGTST